MLQIYHKSNLFGFMYKSQLLKISLDLGTIFRLNLCTVLPIKDDMAVHRRFAVCLLNVYIMSCDYKFVSFLSYQLKGHKKTKFKSEDLIWLWNCHI